MFESKRFYGDERSWTELLPGDIGQLVSQLMRIHIGSVQALICVVENILQHSPFGLNRVEDGLAGGIEGGMGAAGLFESTDQDLIRGIQEQQLSRDATCVESVQHRRKI